MKLDLTYDMEDEYPLGNHSLTDIINLKRLSRLLKVKSKWKNAT